MPAPESVLLDTSAIFALFIPSDAFHQRAIAAYERLADREPGLWVTSYTLVETFALMHRRHGFKVLSRLSEWQRSALEIYWIGQAVHDEAWRQLAANQGRGLSFVDWSTVVVSRRYRAHVFTFDPGFATQGLSVVPR